MAWIETITKEGFQLAVREAMRPEMDKLDRKIERKLEKMESRIGISTFKEISHAFGYYVDKTEFVKNLVDRGKYYLPARPRRFTRIYLLILENRHFYLRTNILAVFS